MKNNRNRIQPIIVTVDELPPPPLKGFGGSTETVVCVRPVAVDNLEQVQVLPMEFSIQEGGRTVVALGQLVSRDHEYVSAALLEAAVLRVGIGDNVTKRDLTDAEIEWVNENEPEWVAEVCDEEWQQENNPEY